jgi:hypothetical protein
MIREDGVLELTLCQRPPEGIRTKAAVVADECGLTVW